MSRFRAPLTAATLLALLGASAGCRPQASGPAPAPATAPASGLRFDDVTAAAGIRFTHFNGGDGRFLLPESIGSGGAFWDYDRDGHLDLLLVNGASWPDRPPKPAHPALYRNRGDGTFEDVTARAGLASSLPGMGCTVGDFDNDGFDDLLITCLGPNRLYRNLGNGRFRDVTPGSGLERASRWDWHTSAAWLDYDRDGRLDLFVCRYVAWTPETDQPCRSKSGRRTYCGPEFYSGTAPLLYRNLGGGRFRNVSAETGLGKLTGKGLGVVPVDENQDGWTDLIVANDLVPNFLLRNQAGRRFADVGQEAGLAVGELGTPRAGMGIDAADLWNNGQLSVAIGNFANEGLALFEHDGLLFTDVARRTGLVPPSLSRLTFGLTYLDADRDGWQDLFAYNGHVDPLVAEEGTGLTYKQLPQLFRNVKTGFTDVTAAAGASLAQPQAGRGSAWGDWDNDGRPDLLLCENGGPAHLLRNTSPDMHHWLGVRLEGRKSNRNAYGAVVRLTANGVTQRRWIRSGTSYLSHSDTRALFGLGAATQAERLEVDWPSGRKTVREKVPLDQYLHLVEE